MTTTRDGHVEQAAAIDADALALTIDHALAHRRALPPHAELEDLRKVLHDSTKALVPVMQKRADRHFRGSTEWYVRQRKVDAARSLLQEGPGDGLVSADSHVRDLARACKALLDDYRKG